MVTLSREFALFIDGIRIERGLSRLDFIEDIISLSQYKRYLRGAASIPNNVVLELASRLKYNISDLYSLYTRKHSKEDLNIKEIYNFIKNAKYDVAFLKLQEINPESFVSEYYKSFYDYCMIHTQHMIGRVSDIHVLNLYSELIGYPNCLNNETFNFVEINVLNQILVVSLKLENFEPANSFYNILTSQNTKFSYSGDSSILHPFYYTIARAIYKQNDYERTIKITEDGINLAILNEYSNALTHLFLLNAFAYQKNNDLESAYISLRKCFLQLILSDNPEQIAYYKSVYESNFDLPIEELLKDIHIMLK